MSQKSICTSPKTEPFRQSFIQISQSEFDSGVNRLLNRSADLDQPFGRLSSMVVLQALDVAESDDTVEFTA